MLFLSKSTKLFGVALGLLIIQAGSQSLAQEGGGRGRDVIRVVAATYGLNTRLVARGNVTWDIERECNGLDFCSYRIDAVRLKDPVRNVQKSYEVEYMCGEHDRRHAALPPEANGQTVELNCREVHGGGPIPLPFRPEVRAVPL